VKKVIVVLFVFLLSSNSYAQDKENRTFEGFKGRKALCFSFDGLDLDKFNGGIGGKKWMSNDLAWFASLNLEYRKRDQENFPGNESDSDWYLYGFSTGFEKHFGTSKRMSPFWGMSIKSTFGKSENNSDHAEVKTKSISKTRDFASNILAGMEFLLSRDISLSAQYNIGLNYHKITDTVTKNSVLFVETENSIKTFGINRVLLTLSFYF